MLHQQSLPARRPATTHPNVRKSALQTIRNSKSSGQKQQLLWRNSELLLPAYAAHRAQCDRDYTAIRSRFPNLRLHSVSLADDADAADADAAWPSGIVTAMPSRHPTFASHRPSMRPQASQSQRHQQRGWHPADADRADSDDSGDDNDGGSSSSSSAAEADGVGRLRHRRRLDAWRLCELLRKRGFGDPRENGRGVGDSAEKPGRGRRAAPRVGQVRFHNHEDTVAGWFARRDLGGQQARRGVASAAAAGPSSKVHVG